MKEIYKTREGHKCHSLVDLPPPTPKEFIYLIQIGEPTGGRKLIKIGTTNNVRRRMGQLVRHYKQNITIFWVSNPYAHFTTLRVEDEMKNVWRAYAGFEHIPNDRFWIPETVRQLSIKVKKEYTVELS